VPFSTTFAEPPAQVAETVSPSLHCGIGATAHDPAVSGAVPRTIASAHEPEIHVTMLPFWMSAFHSLEKSASIFTRSSSMSFCQNSATFRVASSAMPTFHASFSAVNHSPPPCCERPMSHGAWLKANAAM
jgi:hypothetical protein